LLVWGCAKKEIYEKIYEKPHRPVTCLTIESQNDITRYILLKNPTLRKLNAKRCPFVLKATSHYVTSCTSAQAKALGSDFDGFLRLELFENGRLLYRNQRDFKGCLDEEIVESLVKKMERSVGIQTQKREP
jgi:hypothetical protein